MSGLIASKNTVLVNSSYIPIDSITGSYTITDLNSVILADATSNHITASLPTAIGREGKIFHIKKIDSSINHVVVSGSQNIDNDTDKTITVQYTSITVISDNSNWWII